MTQTTANRTLLTWALGISSIVMAVAQLLMHLLLVLGVNNVLGNEEQFKTLTVSWSMLNWLMPLILSLLLIWAALSLLRLRHRAVMAYGLYLLASFFAIVHHAISTDWLNTSGALGVAMATLGFLFYIWCWLYSLSLQKKGRLS